MIHLQVTENTVGQLIQSAKNTKTQIRRELGKKMKADTDPFVPADTGALRSSGKAGSALVKYEGLRYMMAVRKGERRTKRSGVVRYNFKVGGAFWDKASIEWNAEAWVRFATGKYEGAFKG